MNSIYDIKEGDIGDYGGRKMRIERIVHYPMHGKRWQLVSVNPDGGIKIDATFKAMQDHWKSTSMPDKAYSTSHLHKWLPYKGLTEQYEYCDCGVKRHESGLIVIPRVGSNDD